MSQVRYDTKVYVSGVLRLKGVFHLCASRLRGARLRGVCDKGVLHLCLEFPINPKKYTQTRTQNFALLSNIS